MSIKLRRPEAGEDRLSWCKKIPVEIAADDGLLKGSIDCQFKILDLDDFQDQLGEMQDEDIDHGVREFLEANVVSVRGFRDSDGEEWPESDQLDFVCRSDDVAADVFSAYTKHVFGGTLKKINSVRSRERRSNRSDR